MNIEEVKKQIKREGLYISRLPKKLRANFIAWANEDFVGDYGMALKWLWDFKEGLLSSPNQVLGEQIEMLADEIQQLKKEPQQEKKKVIKSMSGKVIAEQEE